MFKLVEAADDRQLAKTIACYGPVDLLLIDELGYMELDRRCTELLFQVLTELEEKNAMALASNQSFSGRTDTLHRPPPARAQPSSTASASSKPGPLLSPHPHRARNGHQTVTTEASGAASAPSPTAADPDVRRALMAGRNLAWSGKGWIVPNPDCGAITLYQELGYEIDKDA